MVSNIERMFNEDIREKKKIGSGIHKKKGTRGYVGTMRFPHSFLKGKELREYTKNGKVEVYNVYDRMISYDDFKGLAKEDQQKHLLEYRKRFSTKEIIASWKIGTNTYYALVNEYQLPKQPRGGYKGRKGTNKTKPKEKALAIERQPKNQPSLKLVQEFKEFQEGQQEQQQLAPIREKVNGLSVSYNGEYMAQEIIDRLTKLELLLDGEGKFKIELNIVELQD